MRRVTLAYSVPANTTSAVIASGTPDDNNLRTLRQIWSTPQAAGAIIINVLRAGFQLEQIESSRFAAGNWPVDVDEQYPALIQFSYTIQNTTGGTLAGTVMLGYDVGASAGSRAAPATPSV